jgi:CRP-like cAMP-binding protein
MLCTATQESNMTELNDAIEFAIDTLPIPVRAMAAGRVLLKTYQHGDVIGRHGEHVAGMMYLISGAVSLNQKLADGSDTIVCFARQRRWLMGSDVVSRLPVPYDGCAVGDVQVLVWPAASFIPAYEDCAELRDFVRDRTLGSLRYVMGELEQTRSLTLQQKLARRLLELADMVGVKIDDQSIKLKAPVSHALLAASLGVTRQRIHGQLREWSALGWVNSSYRDVVLRAPDALRQQAAFI